MSIRWGLVALLLSVGFADLVRGGITWSAVLLTLAYLVAIPWTLVGVRPPHRDEARAVWWAAGAGLVVFLLYPGIWCARGETPLARQRATATLLLLAERS